MKKKIALVTGSNRGIGKEIAVQLSKKNYLVIVTARFAEKGLIATQALKNEGLDVHFEQLDVSDEHSIKEAYKNIKSKYGSVNVIVNNAGVLLDGKNSILDISTAKTFQTLHTNAIGALMVSKIFLPIMPDGGRIIMISSGGGSICEGVSNWAPIYCISKTTLNAITMHLAEALKERNISVNAVCPGWVRTSMGGESANRSVEKGAETPVWLATEENFNHTGKFWRDKEEIGW